MASGYINGGWVFGDNSYRVRVYWSEANQSASNNTSRVYAQVGFQADWSIDIGSRTGTVTINGNAGNVSFGGQHSTGTVWSASRYVDVAHNADGSKSITISGSLPVNATITNHGYIGTLTASATVSLDKLDRVAPTITLNNVTPVSTTSLTLSGSSNVNCDRWDYSIDGGAWTNYSTTSTTSTSKTVSGLSSAVHTVKIQARKTANQIYNSSGQLSVDLVAPTVSFSISNITVSGATISATSNVNCNLWQYSLDGGTNWTQFSTTTGTSASVTLSGLTVNTSYTVSLRARKATNSLYGSAANKSFTTLGNTKINSVTTFYPDDSSATTLSFSRTNYVSTYHHKLEIKNGSTVLQTYDDITYTTGTANAAIEISSTLRSTLLNLIPTTSKTKAITLSLSTYESYSGGTYGTQIGDASTATLTLSTSQANSGPSLVCSVVDTNSVTTALTGDSSVLIRNASTALCTLTATARNSATISSTTINSITTTSYTYNNVAISSFVFYIKDSRGYEVTQTITPTIIDYVIPTVVASNERVSPVSSNQIYLLFSGRYYNGYFSGTTEYNTLTVQYRFKETTADEYGPLTTISNANIETTATSYSNITDLIPPDTFDYRKAYNLRVIVSDRINSVVADVIITKGVPVFDWGEDDFEFHVPVSIDGIDYTISDVEFVELAYYLSDPWSSSGVYSKGEYVTRSSAIYSRNTDMTTGAAWNANDYTLIGYYINGNFEPA